MSSKGEIALPKGFAATTVTVADGRAWVTGTVDGAPAIVLLRGATCAASVVTENAREATLAWSGPDTVTAVTNGALFTIRVS